MAQKWQILGACYVKVVSLIIGLEIGGAPTYIVRLAEEFIEQGKGVKIISLRCLDSATAIMEEKKVPWTCLGMRDLYDLSVLGPIISVLRDLQPQVVHTNHPIDAMLGNLAARALRVPCVTTFHGTLDQYYLPKTNVLSRYLSYLRYLWPGLAVTSRWDASISRCSNLKKLARC